jgi:hypothetical protein
LKHFEHLFKMTQVLSVGLAIYKNIIKNTKTNFLRNGDMVEFIIFWNECGAPVKPNDITLNS